jgi:hypothetical protein
VFDVLRRVAKIRRFVHCSPALRLSPATFFECALEIFLPLRFGFPVFLGFRVNGFTVVESLVPTHTLSIIPTYEAPTPPGAGYQDHDEPERNWNPSFEANHHGVLFVSV